ncbi:MAG: NAD(P)H-dependent oxidoreductase [Actinomycetota bacterium]
MTEGFSDLKAIYLNCTIKYDAASSHTRRLLARSAGIMDSQGVSVDFVHLLEHDIAFGMVKDAKADSGRPADDWPAIQDRIMAADILVLGTPIWLGMKSSVASLCIERMYAYSGDRNEKGQYLYYGKTAGCVVTGNEDGIKACSMQILYAMAHIGYTIPPQPDCGWIGEAGPGPSYGDIVEDSTVPIGYDNQFTYKNCTIMSWNLMHTARRLKDAGGIPSIGNLPEKWRDVANALDQDPERTSF